MTTVVVLREDHAQISRVLDRLLVDASARSVFVVHRNGELVAGAGDLAGVDATALGSLIAGNVAATHGLARLLGEQEFSILFHEGSREHLHLSLVSGGGILVVRFDQRATLGLVRLRVKRAAAELAAIFEGVQARAQRDGRAGTPAGPLRGLTDDDIESLFR